MKDNLFITAAYNEQIFWEKNKTSLRDVLKEIQFNHSHKDYVDEFITRKETAKRLHISLPTLHQYVKNGVIKSYRLKGRILFNWQEIKNSLSEIESVKYRRAQ